MNDWLLAGIVVVGTVLVLGGGAFIKSALFGKKNDPKF